MSKPRFECRFRNATDDAVEVLLHGDIGGWGVSSAEFANMIAEHRGKRVTVSLNSYGGEATAGIAMYNVLRRHPGGADVRVDGVAASAASIVAMAGQRITMATGALMMIHNPWAMAVGDADELRQAANVLDVVRDRLVEIYQARTGQDVEALQQLLANETWMSADQAIAEGFADAKADDTVTVVNHQRDWLIVNGLRIPRNGNSRSAMPEDDAQDTEQAGRTLAEGRNEMAKKPLEVEVDVQVAGEDLVKAKAEEIQAAARKAEQERIVRIQDIARKLGLADEFADEHIKAGTEIAEVQAKAIDERAKKMEPVIPEHGRPHIAAGEDERDKFRAQAVAGLLARAGVLPRIGAANERRTAAGKAPIKVGDPGRRRTHTLLDLARECVTRAGGRPQDMTRDALLMAAWNRREAMALGGLHGTSDFPILFENALHKTLLAAYAVAPDTWRTFCATGTVNDFRDHPRYRDATYGSLDVVAEHGEYTRKARDDARRESIAAKKRGNIFGFTWEMFINDDMGAFSREATKIGRTAGLTIETAVYALLQENGGLGPLMGDGKTMIHADHGNLGTPAALSATSLNDDRVLMGYQQDESNNEVLAINPRILLVPLGLKGPADAIIQAQYDPDSTGSLTPNIANGLVETVVGTARLAAGSTRRWLFADPMDVPVLEVAFLVDNEEPVLETMEGFDRDGIEYRIRMVFALAAVDYKGVVGNAG